MGQCSLGEGVPEGGSSCQSQHQPNYQKKVRVIVWKIRSFHSSSCSLSRPPLSVSVFLISLALSPLPTVRLCCRPPGAQQSGSDDVCSLGPSPPPALHPDLLSSAVEYFLSSARASPRFIFLPSLPVAAPVRPQALPLFLAYRSLPSRVWNVAWSDAEHLGTSN